MRRAVVFIAAYGLLGSAYSGLAQAKDIFEIVKNGSLRKIQAAIKQGADVNAREDHGWTPLIQAAYSRDHLVLAALLKAGAEVNARDDGGDSALMSAAMNSTDPEVLIALMDAGADVMARDRAGCTALDFARRNDRLEGTAAFARLDEATRSAYGRSKDICELARYGPLQNLRAAIRRGGDVNARDELGESPLQIALYYNKDPEAFVALLEAGADPNARQAKGSTPFLYASGSAGPATIAAFLSAGADPKAVDDRGFTPLMMAALGGRPETVVLLLDAGAEVGAKDFEGKTALDLAKANPRFLGSVALERLEAAAGSPP